MLSTDENLVIIYGTISGLLAAVTIIKVAVYRARSRMSSKTGFGQNQADYALGSQNVAVADPEAQNPAPASYPLDLSTQNATRVPSREDDNVYAEL